MPIDFGVEPEFQEQLDWIRAFVDEEITPIDLAFDGEGFVYDKSHPVHEKVLRPLQERVKDRGLWACHLGPELGGLVGVDSVNPSTAILEEAAQFLRLY